MVFLLLNLIFSISRDESILDNYATEFKLCIINIKTQENQEKLVRQKI